MTATMDQINAPTVSEETKFLEQAREIILIKEQKTRLASRESEIKKALLKYLAEYGEPYGSDNQHRRVLLPQAIRGIGAVVRQIRSSVKTDENAAEAIAREKGIYDELFKPVMMLDENAVLVAVERGLLDDHDMARIFPRTNTTALVTEKKDK